MKRFLLAMMLILTLSACAGQAQATEQPLLPEDDGPSAPTQPAELTPAEQSAVAQLAALIDTPAEEIRVVSTEAVEWPDGCLGIERPGMMCTQMIVPGYRIILEAGDKQYEFRTNESGSQVAQAGGGPLGLMVEAITAQLAYNLRLDLDEISVVSSAAVEFPDTCLGVAMQDVACAEAITPGKIIVLEANGLQFEYHISEDGSHVQPATVALVWTREGGIAGFCDRLTVFLSGEAYGSNCRSQEPAITMKPFADILSVVEQDQFFAWAGEFATVNLDASDPKGVADGMTVTLEFFGNGKSQPSKTDQSVMFEFAQRVYQSLAQ